eukprot:TRINITY_DN6466_c0_g2_i3.p1 TRINITY_DN6466_c0_g2~~TRINITY_DN6466_c0_g2_i3.p1  ORF type:complete len:456 (-),score=86.94 TRINITY_DN6466_c0_g2_i3:299-1666(-)
MGTLMVVGGGLAGMSAALEAGAVFNGKIIIIEKEKQLGGNSAKASSGVSALNVDAGDTDEIYVEDTLQSGSGNSDPELVEMLVKGSPDAIQFLESAGLDMSVVVKLGGHRYPRTHSCPKGAVGWEIVRTLISKIQNDPKFEIKTDSQVTEIERDPNDGKVTGVKINGQQIVKCNALVLTTGGYAASQQKLKEYCPHAAKFATTNGSWSTGDGIELGTKIGAEVVDLDQVQIHPTGFVDPADPDAQTKFLAPEKLRGCGAIILNSNGKRFVDELQLRVNVTRAILEQQGPNIWMILSEEGSQKFGSNMGFYEYKGLVKKVERAKISEIIGCPNETIEDEFKKYKDAKDVGKDEFGKTTFPTDMSGNTFYLMQITPVVHYCMGGLKINSSAQVLDARNTPIPGFYAAGEVTGGVHGKNRLAGNSLLECIVFGRKAGRESAMYVNGKTNAFENQDNSN